MKTARHTRSTVVVETEDDGDVAATSSRDDTAIVSV